MGIDLKSRIEQILNREKKEYDLLIEDIKNARDQYEAENRKTIAGKQASRIASISYVLTWF